MVSKEDDPSVLVAAIRAVARGSRVFPAVAPGDQTRAARRLEERDRPIFAMRLAGTSPRDIASVVGLGVAALNGRIALIAAALSPSAYA